MDAKFLADKDAREKRLKELADLKKTSEYTVLVKEPTI